MKLREEHVLEGDMEGSFAPLNAESIDETMELIIYSPQGSS